MFQEPIRFIDDLIQNDRSVLDMLYGNYTFVNPPLAQHYGMPAVPGGPDHWVRVDNADAYGRGGLLPMAVFLTQNAPGLRTSPVKRGYWVAHRVLGEVIPPPPPVVPELPHDEAKSDLPVRDLLAQHRANPVCASCHQRFDVFGLTFRKLWAGRREARTKDLAGTAGGCSRDFPGRNEGEGLEGLQAYIRAHREKDFLNNLSEKMLVYALGRSLAALGRTSARRHARESDHGRLQILFADRYNRYQPAVSEPAKSADGFPKGEQSQTNRKANENDRTPPLTQIARRAILRGAGVTMALPWLESFCREAPTRTTAPPCSRSASASSSSAAASTRITGAPRARAPT